MSAKRQKISHASGSRLGSESGPGRATKDQSPPSSESATLDEIPNQESGEAAPVTFKDLVSVHEWIFRMWRVINSRRASGTHFARLAPP